MTSDSKPKDRFCKVNKWGHENGEDVWRIESGRGEGERYKHYRILATPRIPTETRLRLTILKMVNDGDKVESVGHRINDHMVFVCIPRAEYDELFV